MTIAVGFVVVFSVGYLTGTYCLMEDEITERCLAKTEANKAKLEDALSDMIFTDLEEKEKCFFKCFMEESDWLEPDGTITNSALAEMPEPFKPFFDQCKLVTAENLCDLACDFYACLFGEFKSHQA